MWGIGAVDSPITHPLLGTVPRDGELRAGRRWCRGCLLDECRRGRDGPCRGGRGTGWRDRHCHVPTPWWNAPSNAHRGRARACQILPAPIARRLQVTAQTRGAIDIALGSRGGHRCRHAMEGIDPRHPNDALRCVNFLLQPRPGFVVGGRLDGALGRSPVAAGKADAPSW